MTSEAELAQLLIRMGTDRGLDVETILAEMVQAPLPSFVDANAVRGSMLEAVESWWRADLEERLGQLRRQFQLSADAGRPAVVPTPPVMAPAMSNKSAAAPSASLSQTAPPPPDDATIHEDPEPVTNDPSEALPRDATMIWNTNHG